MALLTYHKFFLFWSIPGRSQDILFQVRISYTGEEPLVVVQGVAKWGINR